MTVAQSQAGPVKAAMGDLHTGYRNSVKTQNMEIELHPACTTVAVFDTQTQLHIFVKTDPLILYRYIQR